MPDAVGALARSLPTAGGPEGPCRCRRTATDSSLRGEGGRDDHIAALYVDASDRVLPRAQRCQRRLAAIFTRAWRRSSRWHGCRVEVDPPELLKGRRGNRGDDGQAVMAALTGAERGSADYSASASARRRPAPLPHPKIDRLCSRRGTERALGAALVRLALLGPPGRPGAGTDRATRRI
jgi:hypothetical protein